MPDYSSAAPPPAKRVGRPAATRTRFYLRDNYGRPFCVTVCWRDTVFDVTVHANDDGTGVPGEPASYPTLVLQVDDVVLWYAGAAESVAGDNDHLLVGGFLLRRPAPPGAPPRYVHVGNCVYEFTAPEEITEYHALVGNNDFPYPVAYSATRGYFLCSEHRLVIPPGVDLDDDDDFEAAAAIAPKVRTGPRAIPLAELPPVPDRADAYGVYYDARGADPGAYPGALLAGLTLLHGRPGWPGWAGPVVAG